MYLLVEEADDITVDVVSEEFKMCGTKTALGGVHYDTIVVQMFKHLPEMLLVFLWVLAGDQEVVDK